MIACTPGESDRLRLPLDEASSCHCSDSGARAVSSGRQPKVFRGIESASGDVVGGMEILLGRNEGFCNLSPLTAVNPVKAVADGSPCTPWPLAGAASRTTELDIRNDHGSSRPRAKMEQVLMRYTNIEHMSYKQ